MTKIIFQCLNKLNNDLKCDDTNCIFNTQGENPKCEYFNDEEETHLYIPDKSVSVSHINDK